VASFRAEFRVALFLIFERPDVAHTRHAEECKCAVLHRP
jgi:hypothetical protein